MATSASAAASRMDRGLERLCRILWMPLAHAHERLRRAGCVLAARPHGWHSQPDLEPGSLDVATAVTSFPGEHAIRRGGPCVGQAVLAAGRHPNPSPADSGTPTSPPTR